MKIQWRSVATACLLALFAGRVLAAGPTLEAQLLNEAALAKKQTASVQVRVTGVELIDPASVGEKPKAELRPLEPLLPPIHQERR